MTEDTTPPEPNPIPDGPIYKGEDDPPVPKPIPPGPIRRENDTPNRK
ncbi:MAG: hypothetical protein IH948_09385 [Bacteroidetes bacterium]|nr:hypothetical protein [Bacteroidota bacterium]